MNDSQGREGTVGSDDTKFGDDSMIDSQMNQRSSEIDKHLYLFDFSLDFGFQ